MTISVPHRLENQHIKIYLLVINPLINLIARKPKQLNNAE
jgi:hypothetical protein